jgi:hypothetical protein
MKHKRRLHARNPHPHAPSPDPAPEPDQSPESASAADPRPRSRGAQPGNHNAFKHGFYSSIFRQHERRLLDELPVTDLSAEIELIRIANRRFLEALSVSKPDLDLQTQLTALRAVNLSAQSISTLLRAQAITSALTRDADELERAFDPPPPAPPQP